MTYIITVTYLGNRLVNVVLTFAFWPYNYGVHGQLKLTPFVSDTITLAKLAQ
jgi:hypothetical protein